MCKEGECLECMQIDRSQLLEYLDKIARYLINEGIIKTDDMTNEEVPGYVVETVSALRERVEALEAAGREILDAEAPRILGEDLEDWLKRQQVAFSKFRKVVQAP